MDPTECFFENTREVPTRLLDWTRSPYVAAFFATADANLQVPSAIWAIDIKAVAWEAAEILSEAGTLENHHGPDFSFSDPKTFNAIFMRDTNPTIVAPVQPFRTNERITSQHTAVQDRSGR
jgi:hypothetical protein